MSFWAYVSDEEYDKFVAALEEMVDEGWKNKEPWIGEIIIEMIDEAPQRVYDLFAALVQAAAPVSPVRAYPEDEYFDLALSLKETAFLKAIPFVCYELADEIARARLPADENERTETREWMGRVDKAIETRAEKRLEAEREDVSCMW